MLLHGGSDSSAVERLLYRYAFCLFRQYLRFDEGEDRLFLRDESLSHIPADHHLDIVSPVIGFLRPYEMLGPEAIGQKIAHEKGDAEAARVFML